MNCGSRCAQNLCRIASRILCSTQAEVLLPLVLIFSELLPAAPKQLGDKPGRRSGHESVSGNRTAIVRSAALQG
jgi:hypothetical protein